MVEVGSLLSYPWSREFVSLPQSSGSPGSHRRANNHLSCAPSFCQLPAFNLPASELSACQSTQYSCVLSQVHVRVSEPQTPNFRDLHNGDPCWSSGGVFPHANAPCHRARKAVAGLCGGSEFMAMCRTELVLRCAALSWALCFYARKQDSTWHWWVFCP